MAKYLVACGVSLSLVSAEPNPPSWPSSVKILSPRDPSGAQKTVSQVYSENGGHNPPLHGQWSNSRYALLFEEGTHAVDVEVGYYTSVMGLGISPSDTTIRNVLSQNGDFNPTLGALCNFWRSAENFRTVPTSTWNAVGNTMLWAVSQACPLRRVRVEGNVQLYQYNSGYFAGYASGGYMSDADITGEVFSGSQQQFMTRNAGMGRWNHGVWNMVFTGCKGAPASHCGNDKNGPAITTVRSTPLIAEKPYLHKDKATGKWYLMVPPAETGKIGPTTNYYSAQKIDFSKVYVAKASDSSTTINKKLAAGLHVVLTPGNYQLSSPIRVTRSNTVVLGIGFPTLIPSNGNVALMVDDRLTGVRISHVLLQAGRKNSKTLFQMGTAKGAALHRAEKRAKGVRVAPGELAATGDYNFIHDLFARVGGPNDPGLYQVSADQMAIVHSDNVVIDNTWLWRADHDVSSSGLVYNGDNPVLTGITINGDNVIAYGLKTEHTLRDMTIWGGENGQTYFYQSEYPYDVDRSYGNNGYVSFLLNDTVRYHKGYGVGVYSFYRDYAVYSPTGIKTGSSSGIKLVNSLSVFLDGKGGINHIVNSKGTAVNSDQHQAWLCSN